MVRSQKTAGLFLALLISTGALFLYLASARSLSSASLEKKAAFVSLTKQPDLAISTEADFIRNRSLATIFTTFRDSPELTEFAPSSFAISTTLEKR